MVGGTNFFRKQSATIDLQNDSQLITSSMSAAILEGTNFTLEEDKLMDGRKVVYFTTGTPAAEGENKAVAKQYIWVEESPYGDAGYLYIYDAGAVVDYNKGNCISELVRYFNKNGGQCDFPFSNVHYRHSPIHSATVHNFSDCSIR